MTSVELGHGGGGVEGIRDMEGNGSMMVLVVVGVLRVVRGLSRLIRQGLIARTVGEEGRGA